MNLTDVLRSSGDIGMIIDLSQAIENDVPADPPGCGPVVAHADHKTGAQQMVSLCFRAFMLRTFPMERSGR
jgi:hypothetical protein